MFGFDSKDFLVFPRFVVFCFEMEKTKTLFCLVFWMDMINQDLKKTHVFLRFCFYCYGLIWFQKPKNKKNCSCFCFFEILVDSMYAKKPKKHVFLFLFLLLWFDTVSKAKNTWVFWFFEILAGSMHAKKETHCFFLLLKPNKTRENQKYIYFESKPNILSKVCFFFVFFGFAALLARLQNQHMMRLCVSACVY